MKIFLGLFLLGISLSVTVHGRGFSKCEVARQMFAAGYSKQSLPDWMCLINSESSFNSSVVGGPNTDGSYDWGLYQINDRYWCSTTGVGKGCNINCNDLIDDYLADDIKCVGIIFQAHNFDGWYGWQKQCRGRDLSRWSVDECFPGNQRNAYVSYGGKNEL